MDRIKKTLYLDPQEEKAFRDEAHESRISESELLRHYLKMIYGIKPDYCDRPALDECKNCSLVNYNRDCRNNKIKEVESAMKLYGTESETFAKTSQGIFIIQSADFPPGKEYEEVEELPEEAEELRPEVCADIEVPEDIV